MGRPIVLFHFVCSSRLIIKELSKTCGWRLLFYKLCFISLLMIGLAPVNYRTIPEYMPYTNISVA